MRVTRRRALQSLAALSVTPLACTRRARGSAPVRFWAVGREGEVAAELVREFTHEYPGVAVEVQKLPFSAAHEKLLTAYAGDTLPDLCQLGNTWVPELVALDALEPLDRVASVSREVELADYFPGFLEANRVGRVLYGIPWYVDTRLLYYRRDLLRESGFDAPPERWDEWVVMLRAIKARVGPQRYSILLPLNEFEPLLVLALQQADPLVRGEGGRWGNFRSDGFRRALSFYASLFERGFAPRMTNTQISNVWDEFGRGFFSFYISGPWNIAEFKKRLPAKLEDAWMTAPMPGPDGPGVSSAGGSSLVIFRTSRRKEEAWLLAQFLSRQKTQRHFYELTGNIPPRRSTWDSPVLAAAEHARAFRVQLDRVRSPPKVPEWERIAQEMRLAAERVVQGAAGIDEAVAMLDRKADRILDKRRWMLERGRLS